MTNRRVSREPYRIRRDPREVAVAVAVGLAIVLVTVALVLILAPNKSTPASPDTTPQTTVPSTSDTTAPPVDTTPTTVAGG